MSARRKAQSFAIPSPLNSTVQGTANSGTSGGYYFYAYLCSSCSFCSTSKLDLLNRSMSSTANNDTKQLLRRKLRQKRRNLPLAQQVQASLKLKSIVINLKDYINAQKIAFYLPNDGEISTEHLMIHALDQNKECYLPCVTQEQKLEFRHYDQNTEMVTNKFGIEEPHPNAKTLFASQLDLVFMPLVGYDLKGNRLGMGGGYYDRTFMEKKSSPELKPKLFGLAHSTQECSDIYNDSWDISIEAIVTETAYIKIK